MTDTVLAETCRAVRILTLNRPEKLNAADLVMQRRLLEEIRAVGDDPDVRVLVLTGAGRAFSAGGDREILRQIAEGTCADQEELGRITLGINRAMLELEIPAIAAVNGLAVGFAAGLVALCDLVVMGRSAFLSDPHVQYGIAATPAAQLVWPHLCSSVIARDILMSGRRVHAEEALRIGLCNSVCEDGGERAAALEMAEPYLALPRGGIAATKRAFNQPLLAEAERAGFVEV
jgi:enoyl-CoA hydratase